MTPKPWENPQVGDDDLAVAHEPVVGRDGYDQRCPACGEREVCTSVMGGVVCMACGWTGHRSDDNSMLGGSYAAAGGEG